ncbi:hypothetical protein ACIOD0_09380 [Kitasatospora albolonga]
MTRAGAAFALAVSGVLVCAGSSSSASVDNIVPTSNYYIGCLAGQGNGTVCQTDNATVTYYMDSGGADQLEAVDKRVVRDMLAAQYAPTDLTIKYDANPTWSGSAETDIYYSEADVPGSATGMAWCNDVASGYKCDQSYIRIEGGGAYSPGLTCHETGHSVGLLHGNSAYPKVDTQDGVLGCMKKRVGYSDALGSNNRNNINLVY